MVKKLIQAYVGIGIDLDDPNVIEALLQHTYPDEEPDCNDLVHEVQLSLDELAGNIQSGYGIAAARMIRESTVSDRLAKIDIEGDEVILLHTVCILTDADLKEGVPVTDSGIDAGFAVQKLIQHHIRGPELSRPRARVQLVPRDSLPMEPGYGDLMPEVDE
jgi:hypothetical protein